MYPPPRSQSEFMVGEGQRMFICQPQKQSLALCWVTGTTPPSFPTPSYLCTNQSANHNRPLPLKYFGASIFGVGLHIHPHCFVVLRDLTSLRCRHIEMWKVRHWNILFGFSGMFQKFSVLVYSGLFRTRISPDGANSWKKTILFFSFIIRYFVAKYWPTPGWDIKVIFLSCWSSGEHLGNFQVGFSRMSEQNTPNKNPWIVILAN